MFTLQADAVALQALHGYFKEILACRGHARDIVLFPFDRCVDIVKNLLDRVGDFSANAISGNERDLKRDKQPVAGRTLGAYSVDTTIFRWGLGDVRSYAGHSICDLLVA